jgi:hypothetical protein
MDTKAYLESIIEHWQPITIVLVAIVATYFIAIFVLTLFNRRSSTTHRDTVWLEITPPANIAKTPEATEQLFSVIHGARAATTAQGDKLYNRCASDEF